MADRLHAEWLHEGVESWNRRRAKVRFAPDLSGIRFFDFLPRDFRDDPKTSRYFEKINLTGANLTNSDLSDLNFQRANFSNSDMSGADMQLSNFSYANFTDSNLSGANASLSYFLGSTFERTKLGDAQFAGATVDGAVLIETLTEKSNLSPSQIGAMSVFQSSLDHKKSEPSNQYAMFSESHQKIAKPKSEDIPPRSAKNRYDVFFATNRNPITERGKLTDFGTDHRDNLSYGVCEVIVPDGHRMGYLGSPMWKRLFNRQDDRIKIHSTISLGDELFWKLLLETSQKMKLRERPTIFIHGYRTSFRDAVLMAAQIGFDIGIGQGIGLFSWPSKGQASKYAADEASVERSKYLLANFIEDFTTNYPNDTINLVAHSMGCRCLVGALEIALIRQSITRDKINQVILAAADIDSGAMKHQGKTVAMGCRRITSYISDLDKALKISKWKHSFPRVGITPPTFVLEGIDTVLVNDLDLGSFSHGYLASNRSILGDIFELLKNGTNPIDRHAIEPISDGIAEYWRIRR